MIVTGLFDTVTLKRGVRFNGLKRAHSLDPKTLMLRSLFNLYFIQ
jgi:hypothetical protein